MFGVGRQWPVRHIDRQKEVASDCLFAKRWNASKEWNLAMTSDDLLKADKPQDGFDTALIDAFVEKAELAEVVEPMKKGLGVSWGGLTICDTWPNAGHTETENYPLGLSHGKGLVIGRQEGGGTEYLDPRFRPTQRMPGTNQRVIVDAHRHSDTFVSRGHFTLIGSPFGIIFVNGVPRRGGGIRPPVNWTKLIHPERRLMLPGERLVVVPGVAITIRLPNMMEVVIAAA
jgi:hypothetical protein